MEESIVVLAEVPLTDADAAHLSALVDGSDAVYTVLIPEDRHTNVLGEFLHHLSLLEIGEALHGLSHRPSEDEVRVTADQALQTSLDALRGAGLRADGVTARGKAVESMVSMVKEREARQAVVITRPHAVADTLHRDWANRAQDQLGIPVLHLYAGSGFIGDS